MNTVEQASQLAEEGLAYGPDVVVLGYVLNDSEDENAAEARRARDWVREAGAQVGRARGLLNHSVLYRLVSGARRGHPREPPPHRRLPVDVRRRLPGLAREPEGALKLMGSVCREKRLPFVVRDLPALRAAPRRRAIPSPRSTRKSRTRPREAGAKVVDLLPLYRGLRWDLLVVDGADDEHPNEIAHRIAAQAIARASTRSSRGRRLPRVHERRRPRRPRRGRRGAPGRARASTRCAATRRRSTRARTCRRATRTSRWAITGSTRSSRRS